MAQVASLFKKHQAERAAKGFDCWKQFTAMLSCQLGASIPCARSATACCLGKLVHLDIAKGSYKSTLSYANLHRAAHQDQSESVGTVRKP